MNNLLKHSSRLISNRFHIVNRCFSLTNRLNAAEGRIGYPNERYEPTTIAALDTDNQRIPLVTGLYEDGFLIGGKDRLVGAIFSFPRQIICWNVSQTYFYFSNSNLIFI